MAAIEQVYYVKCTLDESGENFAYFYCQNVIVRERRVLFKNRQVPRCEWDANHGRIVLKNHDLGDDERDKDATSIFAYRRKRPSWFVLR